MPLVFKGRIVGVFSVAAGSLAATGAAQATRLCGPGRDRRQLEVTNVGTGDGYGTFDQTRTVANDGTRRIEIGETWTPGAAARAVPQNALYAVGDAGCILVVVEYVETTVEELGL